MACGDAEAMALLSPGVRRWVSRQGWESFRPMQRDAIALMLDGSWDGNVVISAGTAAGKSAAAFLPMLTVIEGDMAASSEARVRGLYVAPLKALINDQFRHLEDMASHCGVDVAMWHSDAPQGMRDRLLREHEGVLMTTPESLESFLMNRGEWCERYLHPDVVVIDEFHSFLGEGRGKQLMSLLARMSQMSVACGREPARRVALSATLSGLDVVASLLDPDSGAAVIEEGGPVSTQDVSIVTFPPRPPSSDGGGDGDETDYRAMAREVIAGSGSDKTLTFCRSREMVERMTATVNEELSRESGGTFDRRAAMPHHGLLSRQTREDLEHRLAMTSEPTMAMATVTLELGIDIGDISRVYQVRSASSVASLRQRMGRSGRRDGRQVLEVLQPLSSDHAQSDLVTSVAEVELMRAGWFEPPDARRRDVSVLVSEAMSLVSQYGSAYDDELFDALCVRGAFRNVSEELFSSVLCDLVDRQVLEPMDDGCLLLGPVGEREVSDWHFYATFQDQECYSVKCGPRVIGDVTPPDAALQELAAGGTFQLAGRFWQVVPGGLDFSARTIEVVPTQARSRFMVPESSARFDLPGRVKQVRIGLLTGPMRDYVPGYLDEGGVEALRAARAHFSRLMLNGLGLTLHDGGDDGSEDLREREARIALGYADDALVSCDPPVDPAATNAIVSLLRLAAERDGGGMSRGVSLGCVPLWRLAELVDAAVEMSSGIIGAEDRLVGDAMLGDIRKREKNNVLLSDDTLRLAYGKELIDVPGAVAWMRAFRRFAALPVARRNAGSGGRAAS